MKKRWLIMSLCGMLALAGCADAQQSGKAVTAQEEPAPAANGADNPEKPDAANGQEAPSTATVDRQGETALTPVKLETAYEKAAYLADQVYQANGGADNTIVSPLSLNMALGLAAGGANGKTREELLAYLGTEDYGAFAADYMAYVEELNRNTLNERFGGYQTVFEIANSIWIRDNKKMVASYAEQAKKQFQAEIAQVSFAEKNRAKTVKRINGWCDQKTHGMIPAILSEDAVTNDLALILVNSLYFEAPWVESWGLRQHTFTDLDGRETTQEMLSDMLSCYYENGQATGFSKAYRNGLEFIGILPKQEGDFAIGDLDLASLLQNRRTDVDVSAIMPKLNFETTAEDLSAILQAQGVETAFDRVNADFHGMVEDKKDELTHISKVLQKCKIELDEDGTRAAAVTAIMMEDCAEAFEEREIKEVHLDRPFAFLIYDRKNDQIVFIGKVVTG